MKIAPCFDAFRIQLYFRSLNLTWRCVNLIVLCIVLLQRSILLIRLTRMPSVPSVDPRASGLDANSCRLVLGRHSTALDVRSIQFNRSGLQLNDRAVMLDDFSVDLRVFSLLLDDFNLWQTLLSFVLKSSRLDPSQLDILPVSLRFNRSLPSNQQRQPRLLQCQCNVTRNACPSKRIASKLTRLRPKIPGRSWP